MRTINIRAIGVVIVAMSFPMLFSQCSEGDLASQDLVSENEIFKSDTISSFLNEAEIRGILFMREEEKLARDVYLTLYEIFPLRPFLNISKSEQVHMDAIKYLIDTYGLEDPAVDNPIGIFQNEILQGLYDDLIESGSKSNEEALKVGALIEEIDIIDLQHELDEVAENEDVIRVFQSLLNASENHLRAFVRVLSRYSVEYEPVKLDQELFDSILSE